MIILNSEKAKTIREKYIRTFVNTDSEYYRESIEKKTKYTDGLCYVGYLWDCFKKVSVISESECLRVLEGKRKIYIMWDIHSEEKIFIPNYWKYPKDSILQIEEWKEEILTELPEDIYVFDDSFTWSVAFTHETDLKEERYCVYANVQ